MNPNIPASHPLLTATPMAEPAAERPPGWWQRHWKWAVPTGVVTLMGGVVGFVVLLLAVILGVIKSTEPYEVAVSEARSAPAVIAALGLPIEEGFFVAGNIEMTPGSGTADLAIPIDGPQGRATIFVEADRAAGEWGYSLLEVTVHATGEEIDLLADW
ncbi:MAG: hypothetical protein HKO59_03115 [Phycisphaerales bacterium]|nr:cytochrome c oxidase assembly factor 1 family protein [Phycisphaerae bacterium]NNF43391.1 hypothetical protein [Phycisphaerales bacterium]NNM24972.1 hypothetical protein [Phycisphaerales bacterium]